MQRPSPRFWSKIYFVYEISGEMFSPDLYVSAALSNTSLK